MIGNSKLRLAVLQWIQSRGLLDVFNPAHKGILTNPTKRLGRVTVEAVDMASPVFSSWLPIKSVFALLMPSVLEIGPGSSAALTSLPAFTVVLQTRNSLNPVRHFLALRHFSNTHFFLSKFCLNSVHPQ